MERTVFLRVPSDEALETVDGWQKEGNDLYSAVQADILVVKRREDNIRKGAPLEILELPGGSEYTLQSKKATVVKNTEDIQRTIQDTVSTKFSSEVAAKIASEAGISGLVTSGKLSAETSVKAGAELSDAIQDTLARKRSFEVQDSEEVTRGISIKPSSDGRPREPIMLRFYLGLWPWHWEFYLGRVRYIQLRHREPWYWWDVRETILKQTVEPKLPLFSVLLYEPQDKYSISDLPYTPDVSQTDMEGVVKQDLDGKMPKVSWPSGPSLEELARLAFPVNEEERESARKKTAKRSAAKPAPKASKARKARAARTAPKHRPTARKSAMRKPARRRAPRRHR